MCNAAAAGNRTVTPACQLSWPTSNMSETSQALIHMGASTWAFEDRRTSTVLPLAAVRTSPGRIAVASIMFSQAQTTTCSCTGAGLARQSCIMTRVACWNAESC